MKTLRGVVEVLVPGLGDPQPHAGPLVHYADGQGVELLLAPLWEEGDNENWAEAGGEGRR